MNICINCQNHHIKETIFKKLFGTPDKIIEHKCKIVGINPITGKQELTNCYHKNMAGNCQDYKEIAQ
jgi:hypothetical protein